MIAATASTSLNEMQADAYPTSRRDVYGCAQCAYMIVVRYFGLAALLKIPTQGCAKPTEGLAFNLRALGVRARRSSDFCEQ